MSYASDVYASLASELELYDSVLSTVSTPVEKTPALKGQSVSQPDSEAHDEVIQDQKKPIRTS